MPGSQAVQQGVQANNFLLNQPFSQSGGFPQVFKTGAGSVVGFTHANPYGGAPILSPYFSNHVSGLPGYNPNASTANPNPAFGNAGNYPIHPSAWYGGGGGGGGGAPGGMGGGGMNPNMFGAGSGGGMQGFLSRPGAMQMAFGGGGQMMGGGYQGQMGTAPMSMFGAPMGGNIGMGPFMNPMGNYGVPWGGAYNPAGMGNTYGQQPQNSGMGGQPGGQPHMPNLYNDPDLEPSVPSTNTYIAPGSGGADLFGPGHVTPQGGDPSGGGSQLQGNPQQQQQQQGVGGNYMTQAAQYGGQVGFAPGSQGSILAGNDAPNQLSSHFQQSGAVSEAAGRYPTTPSGYREGYALPQPGGMGGVGSPGTGNQQVGQSQNPSGQAATLPAGGGGSRTAEMMNDPNAMATGMTGGAGGLMSPQNLESMRLGGGLSQAQYDVLMDVQARNEFLDTAGGIGSILGPGSPDYFGGPTPFTSQWDPGYLDIAQAAYGGTRGSSLGTIPYSNSEILRGGGGMPTNNSQLASADDLGSGGTLGAPNSMAAQQQGPGQLIDTNQSPVRPGEIQAGGPGGLQHQPSGPMDPNAGNTGINPGEGFPGGASGFPQLPSQDEWVMGSDLQGNPIMLPAGAQSFGAPGGGQQQGGMQNVGQNTVTGGPLTPENWQQWQQQQGSQLAGNQQQGGPQQQGAPTNQIPGGPGSGSSPDGQGGGTLDNLRDQPGAFPWGYDAGQRANALALFNRISPGILGNLDPSQSFDTTTRANELKIGPYSGRDPFGLFGEAIALMQALDFASNQAGREGDLLQQGEGVIRGATSQMTQNPGVQATTNLLSSLAQNPFPTSSDELKHDVSGSVTRRLQQAGQAATGSIQSSQAAAGQQGGEFGGTEAATRTQRGANLANALTDIDMRFAQNRRDDTLAGMQAAGIGGRNLMEQQYNPMMQLASFLTERAPENRNLNQFLIPLLGQSEQLAQAKAITQQGGGIDDAAKIISMIGSLYGMFGSMGGGGGGG
jgi:hypothetical protein